MAAALPPLQYKNFACLSTTVASRTSAEGATTTTVCSLPPLDLPGAVCVLPHDRKGQALTPEPRGAIAPVAFFSSHARRQKSTCFRAAELSALGTRGRRDVNNGI